MDALRHTGIAAALLSVVVILLATPAGLAAAKTLVVEAGTQARTNVPMSVVVPDGATKAKMLDGTKEVPCQVVDGKLCWILDSLAAGATKTYVVDLGMASSADAKAVEFKQGKDAIDITIDGKPFTTYVFLPGKPGGVELHRPYFYPVFGPGQTSLMRPYPLVAEVPAGVTKDHPHHTGIWVAYGEVNDVDNWSVGAKAGWQLHKAFEQVTSGPVVGVFRETLDWTAADKKPNLAEVRTVRVWRLPDTGRILDIEVAFQAKYGNVTFGDTKEGGIISTRMRGELQGDKNGKEGRLVNARGQSGDPAWGKPAEWVDDSGMVDGKRVGYAVFDTPGNLRFPTPWHARTYGLLTANPFGAACFDKTAQKGDYTLESGKELVLRYRLYFHPGDEKEGQVAARYADYANPPKTTWK